MKFMSWNVNGLRAALRHGFVNTFTDLDADIFAIQERQMKYKLTYQAIINTGIMPKERAMLVLLSLLKKSQLQSQMDSAFQKLMARVEVLL